MPRSRPNHRVKIRFSSLLAAALLALGLVAGCGPSGPTPTPAVPVDGVLEVDLINYAYEPMNFQFERGETVEFRLLSVDELHTFTVPDLNINWKVPKQDEPQIETFRFTRPGVYSLICTVTGHEGYGMVGAITVIE